MLFINYLWKMPGYPQFSFWISMALVKIYISWIIINRGKNTFELVGTVLKLIIFYYSLPRLIFQRKMPRSQAYLKVLKGAIRRRG